jgi:hypothetical protein
VKSEAKKIAFATDQRDWCTTQLGMKREKGQDLFFTLLKAEFRVLFCF